jgi:hypothetical protein
MKRTLSLVLALVAVSTLSAQNQPAGTTLPFADVPWRNIGPAVTGTRIVDLAVVEKDPRVIYAATASSGLWKTADAGVTWAPTFQNENTVALGGVAVSQSNPDVVWVATGEPNVRNLRSTTWGDGVYKSTDAGKTWRHMGLADSAHTGRIVIHPTNPDVVFASVSGALWHQNAAQNAARGLWKTSNGGTTWKKVIEAGADAGVVEVAFDLSRPTVMYAASWQRERRDFSFIPSGPGTAVEDNGRRRYMAEDRPVADVADGRIGLSVCRCNLRRVRRDRRCERLRDKRGRRGSAQSRHRIVELLRRHCDPTDPQRVFFLQTAFSVSTDGGATFKVELRRCARRSSCVVDQPREQRARNPWQRWRIYQSFDKGANWLSRAVRRHAVLQRGRRHA